MTPRNIEAEIGLCLLFAAVDGEISELELAALADRLGTLLGDDFDPMLLPALIEGEMGTIEKIGVDDYVAGLPERLAEDRRFEAVRAACVVACADGLAPEEEEVVRQVCGILALDPAAMIERVGAIAPAYERKSTRPDDEHVDEPDAQTKLIGERLEASGWSDPMRSLRSAGINVGGFGAVALQYESASGHRLRLEHHTCDGSVHLHITNSEDAGGDFVVYPEEAESDLLDTLVAMQDTLTLDNMEAQLATLLRFGRVCVVRGERLHELVTPS